jgi:MOSC domain-containing protein YiiM
VKLTVRENRTGFFTRVIEPGAFAAGDAWDMQERLNPDGSIPAINHCIYLEFDPVYAGRVIEMPGLGEWWKEQFAERLSKVPDHWTESIQEW